MIRRAIRACGGGLIGLAVSLTAFAAGEADSVAGTSVASLEKEFAAPPDSARPWVYWYFMDGNMTREGLTADLEAMKAAGIGGALFLEVGIGIPRGPVEFMSEPWRALLKHAVSESDRLGIEMAIGSGPGWCGTGGPWVKPEQSMQHLVAAETTTRGPSKFNALLPRPNPRTPFFGINTLPPPLRTQWESYYRDVAVLAFPTPAGNFRIADADEKALYYRAPYSSKPGVKPLLSSPAEATAVPAEQCIDRSRIVDLTDKLSPDGRLVWDVPPGDWTILRFGRTITGQTTRPAPAPGLGLECDKFERAALDAHFEAFIGTLLKTVGEPAHPGRGLTTLHFDSWEMSSQNWSENFRREFTSRRGYDPLLYLPAMTGRAVQSAEFSERFLWDLRQTAQELVVANHAQRLKELGRRHGLQFSLEPYDMNPCADLTLGAAADVPQCEFWSRGYGFSSEYSCYEAASIGHTLGRPIVAAEAFTANSHDAWHQHPASMKNQGDWALCAGVNRFVFHRYQHQPWLDRFPGMTMGPYGVYWERTQTWWDMAVAYHTYLARCQHLLRQGRSVADILYLVPEGAPNVFRPPTSATQGDLPDHRGYNFDGCAPEVLIESASVREGWIVFPHGARYRLLVLPRCETMTPRLLAKVKQLVEAGAAVVGAPPKMSPSLVDYPQCDRQVGQMAAELWGTATEPRRTVGKGMLFRDVLSARTSGGTAAGAAPLNFDMYADYDTTAKVLAGMGLPPDMEADGPVRFIHRATADADLYFIANREDKPVAATCRFRVTGPAQWWDPITGRLRDLPECKQEGVVSVVPVRLAPHESGFVVFRKTPPTAAARGVNFPAFKPAATVSGPWEVAFDPKWGGPAKITFAKLDDWSKRPEKSITQYSGKAVYRTTFDVDDKLASASAPIVLSLGEVKVMAAVKLNGKELGIAWCPPWRVEIPTGLLKTKGNMLEITVANLWINRLIGDSAVPAAKRLTWTTRNPYKPNSPLEPSGLLGPVMILAAE